MNPPLEDDRKCWKGHAALHLTGVVVYGEMLFTCHEHFEELKGLPPESDWLQRRDN